MANELIFKGIQQVKALPTNPEKGVIYFVREHANGVATGNAKVYFGGRLYGEVATTQLANLQSAITANSNSITAIQETIGEWSEKFNGSISTIANAVIAVSGTSEANKIDIATLKGNSDGSVAKAVADAKSELLGDAGTNYNTLGKLEDEIQKVALSVTNKNVDATGDTYVSANATGNKVTVAATQKTIDAIALAETALQKTDITTGSENGTISVDGSNVAVMGLGSAAYTNAGAYDASGAAAAVKTELVNGASDGYNTLKGLETEIKAVAGAAKSYEIKAITTGLNSNVKEAYGLFDEDGVQTGATINIYKDSSLKEVKLSGQSLQFTYILADGTESTVGVDVSTFLAESEFGNGLEVVDHIVKVKVDSTSEGYLTVSNNGVKLSGINNKLDEKLNVATFNNYTGSTKTKFDTLQSGKTDVSVFEAHTAATSLLHTTLSNDINGVRNALTAHTENFKTYSADTKSVLDDIESRLTAITDNAVTSVASSANTITVTDNGDGAINIEVNTLAVATAQASGYIALEKTNNGALYGVMYYGGDDTE